MISEATVRQVKYPPELIPDSWFGNVVAAAEVAPPVLDLRRFKPYITELVNIQVTPSAAVVLRARYDDLRVDENTQAMVSLIPAAWALPGVGPLPGAWRMLAKEILYLNFFGIAPGFGNYTTHFALWVKTPTVADKLLYGITLTNEEKALAEKYGIYNSVEKGVLPIPISQQIEREYKVLGEETHSRSVTILVANTRYAIESIYPRANEIVVLTRITAAPGAAGQIVRLVIDRDDDADYADVMTFPLSLEAGGEVECYIPATKEIRLTTEATVAPGIGAPHLFRFTYQRVKLTNTLRARFGLASKEELPGDTYEKVLCGVL